MLWGSNPLQKQPTGVYVHCTNLAIRTVQVARRAFHHIPPWRTSAICIYLYLECSTYAQTKLWNVQNIFKQLKFQLVKLFTIRPSPSVYSMLCVGNVVRVFFWIVYTVNVCVHLISSNVSAWPIIPCASTGTYYSWEGNRSFRSWSLVHLEGCSFPLQSLNVRTYVCCVCAHMGMLKCGCMHDEIQVNALLWVCELMTVLRLLSHTLPVQLVLITLPMIHTSFSAIFVQRCL